MWSFEIMMLNNLKMTLLSLFSVSASGTDLATRRQAAADVLQTLVSSGYEAEATEIVGAWINTGLGEYGLNKKEKNHAGRSSGNKRLFFANFLFLASMVSLLPIL
jgi:hypothetical protein